MDVRAAPRELTVRFPKGATHQVRREWPRRFHGLVSTLTSSGEPNLPRRRRGALSVCEIGPVCRCPWARSAINHTGSMHPFAPFLTLVAPPCTGISNHEADF